MGGRMLRLLCINDEEVKALGAQFIETVMVPIGSRHITRLAHWHQHMQLWGKGLVPAFDLLLIDIRFDRDPYDPAYFGEQNGPQIYTSPEKAANPLGLLHALPIVARQDLTNMPFVWGVHSGDPSSVQDDPVAVVAYGLLCAMERRPGWDQYNLRAIPAHFQKQLATLQALSPEQAWRSLIPRYRDRLLEACAERVRVDTDWLEKLIAMAEDISRATGSAAEEVASLANESLFVYSGYDDEDALLLRSLFADVECWDRHSVADEVLGYLHTLKEVGARGHIFPHVRETIRILKADPNATLTRALPKTPNRAWIGVGVIVCLWLERFYHNRPRKAKELLGDMGCIRSGVQENGQAPRRLLLDARIKLPLGKFLNRLETEPLAAVWRECGRKYYREVLDGESSESPSDKWPACLGPE